MLIVLPSHYSHTSMLIRSALTALDYNANIAREQVWLFHNLAVLDLFLFTRQELWMVCSGLVWWSRGTGRSTQSRWSRFTRTTPSGTTLLPWFSRYALTIFLLFFIFILQSIQNGTTPRVVLPIGQNLPSVRPIVVKPDKKLAISQHQSRFL